MLTNYSYVTQPANEYGGGFFFAEYRDSKVGRASLRLTSPVPGDHSIQLSTSTGTCAHIVAFSCRPLLELVFMLTVCVQVVG